VTTTHNTPDNVGLLILSPANSKRLSKFMTRGGRAMKKAGNPGEFTSVSPGRVPSGDMSNETPHNHETPQTGDISLLKRRRHNDTLDTPLLLGAKLSPPMSPLTDISATPLAIYTWDSYHTISTSPSPLLSSLGQATGRRNTTDFTHATCSKHDT
jgi:hypothetical protein